MGILCNERVWKAENSPVSQSSNSNSDSGVSRYGDIQSVYKQKVFRICIDSHDKSQCPSRREY